MSVKYDDLYTERYFSSQLDKFKNRRSNHWAPRIARVFETVKRLELSGKRALDLGTSVGTYAYEFASRGFDVTGVDLSPRAIALARSIALTDGISIDYVVGDAADRSAFRENTFDIIYGGDIIEHLDPESLKNALDNCHYWLKDRGYFVFHTVPTKYNVIFHKTPLWILLAPFSFMPERGFKKMTEALYAAFNASLKLFTGRSWHDREASGVHCNLQTKDDMERLLKTRGFNNIIIELATTEGRFSKGIKAGLLGKKEYYQKDIFGVARKGR